MKVKTFEAIVYRVYFESLYDEKADQNTRHCCVVMASDVNTALMKVKEAFPGEVVNSISTDRGFMSGPSRPDQIVL